MPKIIDGEIQIQANVGIHVDETTFKTCLHLITMYAKENNMNAMVVKFDDNYYGGYQVEGITGTENLSWCPLCYQEIKRERE